MSEFTLLTFGFETIEGPTVDDAGGLFFSDPLGGGVYRLRPDGVVDVVVPKRKAVGGLCLHADGGIVISGRDLSHIRDGQSAVLLSRDDVTDKLGPKVNTFNDIHATPDGRIFVGVTRIDDAGQRGGIYVLPVDVPGTEVGRARL